MTKKWMKFQGVILVVLAFCCFCANAAQQLPRFPQEYPSFLPSYEPPPPLPQPPLLLAHKWAWLTHFYVAGRFVVSFAHLKDVALENPQPGDPMIGQSNQNKSVVGGGVAVGYIFKKSGLLSRIEIEYIHHAGLSFNPNPVFIFPFTDPPIIQLNSNINNQTLLAKFYYDINTGTMIMPYVQGGAGLSHNKVESNSSDTVPLPPPLVSPTKLSSSTFTKTQFAWDAGAGVRLLFGQHVSMNVGYQLTRLGDLGWRIEKPLDPDDPFILGANKFYTNSLVVGLMVHG